MTNKNKNILLGVLIVGVLSMTVAFAALSTRLNIQGTTNVAATSWNIHFYNWQPVSIPTVTVGGQTHNNTAVAPAVNQLTMSQQTNTTKVENVNVTLNQPGDTAKYTFEIVNEGSIDGKLSNFTVTDTSQNALVDYDVKCYADSSREGVAITTNHVLTANGGRVYCYLQVSYKDQENSHTAGSNQVYHQDSISTNVSAAWTWVQNDGASSPATSSTPEPQSLSWNKYITLTQSEGNTLPQGAKIWIQENTTTGDQEVCGKSNGQTVCFEASRWDYYCDPQEELDWEPDPACEQQTYMYAKKLEIEQILGANTCTLESDYILQCSTGEPDGTVQYSYSSSSGPSVSDGTGTCELLEDEGDITASCYTW